MRLVSAEDVNNALHDRALIEALREMFRLGCDIPLRHHHKVPVPGATAGTLLLMPAWQVGEQIGIKLVTVFPDNGRVGLASILGQYLLLDGTTGQPMALIDGVQLTLRRTACASALAADYLARPDASRLVMVGAGALAPYLIRAHAAVRPIRSVTIWNRNGEKAQALAAALAAELASRGIEAVSSTDLEAAVGAADIVSCATLSPKPLVMGAWLPAGCHLDLVGAFRPHMRECDDRAVTRARIYVDTREGAMAEGGDIAIPLASGAITEADVRGDLFDLTRGSIQGRTAGQDTDITLFKSVGAALEDLAAARLVMRNL